MYQWILTTNIKKKMYDTQLEELIFQTYHANGIFPLGCIV